jgi:hypothetical protein
MKAGSINLNAVTSIAGLLAWLAQDAGTLRAADTSAPSWSSRIRERTSPGPINAPALPSASLSNALPELQLTGLIDLSAKKWVFLVKAEHGQPLKQYSLHEGEKADGLEILAIDVRAEKVTVRNAGVEMVLTFKTHGRPAVEQALVVEKQFVDDHVRAHELHQQRERERIERERAEVERSQALTPSAWPAAGSLPDPGGSTPAPAVSSVFFSPDGTQILSRAPDGTLRIWDQATGRPALETPPK